MYRIGAIGQEEKIVFLKAMGIEVFSLTEKEEVKSVLKEIDAQGDFGIIFIDSKYLKMIQKYREGSKLDFPIMLALPDFHRNGEPVDNFSKVIKKAIGTDKIIIK